MLPEDFPHSTISTWNYDAANKQAAEVNPDSFWYIPPTNAKPGEHPCPYPEKLVELILKVWTRRGDLIIDPYNGSGTTTVVAQRLGRRFLGMDLSEEYCAIARKRIADQIEKAKKGEAKGIAVDGHE